MYCTKRMLAVGLLIACVWQGIGFSQESLEARQPQQAEGNRIAELIDALGSDDFSIRRDAFTQLLQLGSTALADIRDARASNNLQIAISAKALEPLLGLDLSQSDLNGELVDLLIEPSPGSVLQLCRRGKWDLAEKLVKSNFELADAFQTETGRYYSNQIVESALAQHDSLLAWPIIRLTLDMPDAEQDGSRLSVWIATRKALQLDAEIERQPETVAQRMLYAGRAQESLEAGASVNFRRKATTRGAVWSQLTRPDRAVLISGNPRSAAAQAVEAIRQEFSGDFAASDATWQELLRSTQSEDPDDKAKTSSAATQLLLEAPASSANQLMLAMLLSGRSEAVGEYLNQFDSSSAFGFFAAGNHYAETLATVGLDPQLANFNEWLLKQESAIRAEASTRGRGSAKFYQTSHVCSLIFGLGFHEEAARLLDMLADVAGKDLTLWSGSIVSWMGNSEQRVLCLEAVGNHINNMPRSSQQDLLARLFPEFGEAAYALLRATPSQQSSGETLLDVQLLDKLHSWDTQFFDENFGTSTVRDWITRTERLLIASQTASRDPLKCVQQLVALAKLADGCGLTDLALQLGNTDVRDYGAPSSVMQSQWLQAARILARQGKSEEAETLLRSWRTAGGGSNDQVALTDEVRMLFANGNFDDAIELDRSILLRPLAVSRYYQGEHYSQAVAQLQELGRLDEAKPYAELAYMLADFSSLDVYRAASDLSAILEEQKDFGSSADVLRGPLVEMLEPDSELLGALVSWNLHSSLLYSAQRERIHRAVVSIDQKNFVAAKRHFEIGQRLQPQDIEMAVQCVPKLLKEEQRDLANEMFDSYEANMLKQIETWPNDATALNNLAWMYSQCDRKLDEALPLSEKAVALAPHSATFLDTLAEVHFRRGDIDEAIKLMQQCIRIDPRDLHYRQNLDRFIGKRMR